MSFTLFQAVKNSSLEAVKLCVESVKAMDVNFLVKDDDGGLSKGQGGDRSLSCKKRGGSGQIK